jgi:hypothetical protein
VTSGKKAKRMLKEVCIIERAGKNTGSNRMEKVRLGRLMICKLCSLHSTVKEVILESLTLVLYGAYAGKKYTLIIFGWKTSEEMIICSLHAYRTELKLMVVACHLFAHLTL